MAEKVTIWYRGASYALGRGQGFYGIWPAGAPQAQPFEWWPETPEGWYGAWARFTGIEAPGTIVPVGQRATRATAGFGVNAGAGPGVAAGSGDGTGSGAITGSGDGTLPAAITGKRTVVAAALLGVGVVCGIAGLFPGYLAGASLAQQSANLVPHGIYLAAWTASAVLILLGGARLRLGALLGAGTSIITFGLFFADLGTAIAGGAHLIGVGLVLGLMGWLACAAGSAVALQLRSGRLWSGRFWSGQVKSGQVKSGGAPGRLGGRTKGSVLTLVLAAAAGLGAAIAFAPSWDSYTLRTAAGASQTVTAGNAFANPAPMIAGDVMVMVALVAVAVVAALWRPARQGAALLAGATIPMAAQAISALVQLAQAASPAQFGISPAQGAQLGLTISSGLTPVFWIYCAFIVALAATCARMLRPARPVVLDATPPRWPQADPAQASWPAAGGSVSAQP